jgi:multidrug efflux pump subunit AcrA (membrane-fusion protein)
VQASFPAVVLSAEPLAQYRAKYVALQSQQNKAQIRAAVSGKEFERLKALSGPERNVSEKALQASEAAWQADQADVRAAAEQLDLQTVALSHEWGDVVAKWAADDAPELQHILDRSRSVVQLTMPAGSASPPPREISLSLPDGGRVPASFVSAFPRVDPRIQGRSFLYTVSSRSELAPGLSLVARFPLGAKREGVLVPTSAVLWSEGKAWVYEELAPGRYSRIPVSTDLPVEDGYLAPEGLSAGDRVVTVGAQELLSEEILLHSQGGGDED